MTDKKMEIAASYERKVNHDLYGGAPYESSSHFCSAKMSVNEAEKGETYRKLHDFCRTSVEEKVAAEILSLGGGVPVREWNAMLDNFIRGEPWGTAEDWERMSPFQQHVFQIIKRARRRIKQK